MNEECVTETLKYNPQGKKGWEIKVGTERAKRLRNVLRFLTEFSLEIHHTPSRAHTASYSVGTGDIFSGD